MGHCLRDKQINNLFINAEALKEINSLFLDRCKILEDKLKGNNEIQPILSYIIKFDDQGYRIFDFEELLRYFQTAKSIERIIFTLETSDSLQSNRITGTCFEVRLNEKEPNFSSLLVSSDDKEWVNSTFFFMQEVLTRYKNKNAWVRTAWTRLVVQIIGIVLGFILSLAVAAKLTPLISLENAFVFSFFFFLLLFSNIWIYLNEIFLLLLNLAFPNIKFCRTDNEIRHWLLQAIVGGIVVTALLIILSQAASSFLSILNTFILKDR